MNFTVKYAEKITDNDKLYQFMKDAFIDAFKKRFVTDIKLLEYPQQVLYAVDDNDKILGILSYGILDDICWIYFCYTHYTARKRKVGITLLKYLRKLMEKDPDVYCIRYATEWLNKRMIRVSRYHLPFKPKQIIYEWKLEEDKNEKI